MTTRSRWTACIVAALCAAFLSGCLVAPVSVAPSTHLIGSKTRVTKLGHSQGSAWGVFVFGYGLSDYTPVKTARDMAINSKGADALIDVTVEFRSYFFGPVTVYETTIEGEAVKLN